MKMTLEEINEWVKVTQQFIKAENEAINGK